MSSRIKHSTSALVVGSLGVVFGDIGTSPLYAFKVCFSGHYKVDTTPDNVLGLLSLFFWSLNIVLSFKYVVYILKVEDQGEGGIFPMLAVLHHKLGARTPLAATMLALFGAALLYGDGVITPVISVLSALEGLEVATSAAREWVVPLTLAVLAGLFAIQRHGTGRIGKLFGPLMILWFAALAGLGVMAILQRPEVLEAMDPRWAVVFFMQHRLWGLFMLGNVVLCVTGCEALHADMGHFGRRPIQISWVSVAGPALILNYFGQGALVLANPSAADEPFYGLAPHGMLVPLVILSTAATIIASQAIISGVFSQTRQAMQLGFLPRVRVVHTSDKAEGQIYLPTVNFFMFAVCVALTLGFKRSDQLAEAYGIAVTATMLIASILFYGVAKHVWGWNLAKNLVFTGLFLLIDTAYFASCIVKFASGGWFPLAIAGVVMLLMLVWKDGWRYLSFKMYQMRQPLEQFVDKLRRERPVRVPGTAVFLSTFRKETPPMLLSHLEHNSSLHEQVVILSILTSDLPVVDDHSRLEVKGLGEGVYRVVAQCGFMETPDVPAYLRLVRDIRIDPSTARYYLGRISLSPGDAPLHRRWRRALFSFMHRNAVSPAVYYNIPVEQVLELGVQVKF